MSMYFERAGDGRDLLQVALLQDDLKAEMLVVEEKKASTFALIESIGQEKGVVDEAVESGRADEEDAARLQVRLPSNHTLHAGLFID